MALGDFKFDPEGGWNDASKFPNYPARDQVRPLMQKLFDQIKTWLNGDVKTFVNGIDTALTTHKAETMSYIYTTTRDLAITGEQVVTLPTAPKAMFITSHVFNVENKYSIGMWSKFNNSQCVLGVSANGLNFDYTTRGVLIAENGTDTTLGMISVSGNQLTINWTHTGAGATGTVRVRILTIAHGGA